jgi:hypothetical protein
MGRSLVSTRTGILGFSKSKGLISDVSRVICKVQERQGESHEGSWVSNKARGTEWQDTWGMGNIGKDTWGTGNVGK